MGQHISSWKGLEDLIKNNLVSQSSNHSDHYVPVLQHAIGWKSPTEPVLVSKERKRVFFSLLFLFAFFHRRETSENGAKQRRPGDWVRMGDREHGAKGLCQERALVSGLEVGVFGGIQTWRMVRMVGMMDFLFFFHIECV